MKVFLAGAAGAIGRRLVPLLLRDGHEVTGTTRSAEKARELVRPGVPPAVLGGFDPQAMTAALRCMAVVISVTRCFVRATWLRRLPCS